MTIITAQYAGNCYKCGGLFYAGDEIVIETIRGIDVAMHKYCADRDDQP